MQMALPWASALDVSYVASHGYNLVNAFNQPVDINAPDFGAAFLPQNQDPTLSSATPGGAALTTDLLRPFRGYGADQHAVAALLERLPLDPDVVQPPLQKGLQFGFNYTLTLRTEGHQRPRRDQRTAPGAQRRRQLQRVRRTGTKPRRCWRTTACAGTSSRATSCGICPDLHGRPRPCRRSG